MEIVCGYQRQKFVSVFTVISNVSKFSFDRYLQFHYILTEIKDYDLNDLSFCNAPV